MEAGQVGRLVGAARAGLGLVALVLPELPARPWVGPSAAASTAGRVLARALGGRDLVLGLGAMTTGARSWVMAGAAADALDAAVTLGAFAALPRRGRLLVLAVTAGAAAAGGLVAIRQVR